MNKERLKAIDYIRGISMLGVIGIHVGSEYLTNPMSNIHLVALFEIVTRFCVPIFFFISAFGLFRNFDANEKFSYRDFLKKRLGAVLVPYLSWTAFYIVFNAVIWHVGFPPLWLLPTIIFLDPAKYQLYFLVILIWFYALMPLWRFIVPRLNLVWLAVVLVLQIAFNNFSSGALYGVKLANPFLQSLIHYRLNYLILHYLFIFLLGGYVGLHFEKFLRIAKAHFAKLAALFFISLLSILGYYYKLILLNGFKSEWAVNTAQQLSPPGIFYTAGASLFLFAFFTFKKLPAPLESFLDFCGKHSFFVYLFHPVALTFLMKLTYRFGLIVTAPVAITIYLLTATSSLIAAKISRDAGKFIPLLNRLTIGSEQ